MIPAGTVRIKSYFASSIEQAIAQARLELGADALLLNTRKTSDADGTSRYEVTMGVPGSQPSAAPRSSAPVISARPSSAPPSSTPLISAPPVATRVSATPPSATPPSATTPISVPPFSTAMALAPPPINLRASAAPESDVLAGLATLREQIAEIQGLLAQQGQSQLLKSRLVPELARLHQGLLDAQVDPVLSLDIIGKMEGLLATDAFFRDPARGERRTSNRWKVLPTDPRRVEEVLRQEMERRVRFGASIGVEGGTGAPVAVMVGPTGGGKTTSLVKLATNWAEQSATPSSNLPVRIISLDADRPGAPQQLQALVRGPAIRHSVLKTIDSLPAIIADLRDKECLFIDTPGFMKANAARAELLAKVLKDCPDLDVHLVIPAYLSAADFKNTIERYRVFQPAKLLVTKLDEAQAFGMAFSMAVYSGLALSFLADGPRVPEDLHPATPDAVFGTMGEWPRAQAHHAA